LTYLGRFLYFKTKEDSSFTIEGGRMKNNLTSALLLALLIPWQLFSFSATEPMQITVFVHGIMKPPDLSISNIIKIMRSNIDNSLYYRTIYHMRRNPLLLQAQPMQDLGLHKIYLSPDAPKSACQAVAHLYDIQLEHLNIKPEFHTYYTFGWSALLNYDRRVEGAQQLYEALHTELDKLEEKGIKPTVRVIAYSHGGNVSLNLAKVKAEDTKKRNRDLIINELITVGMPIHRENDLLLSSDVFKKIFHLYSNEDAVQGMFTRRQFTHNKNTTIPGKLTQVRTRVTKKIKLKHKVKLRKEDPNYKILESHKVKLVHKDPGHIELWCFNWGNSSSYRNSFPLNPLPMMAFIPTIIHHLHTHQPKRRNISFDYCPSECAALIRRKERLLKQAIPFLPKDIQNKMWKLAESYTPKNWTAEMYQNEIDKAMKLAREEHKQYKKSFRLKNKALAHSFERLNSRSSEHIPHFKKIRKTHLLSAKI